MAFGRINLLRNFHTAESSFWDQISATRRGVGSGRYRQAVSSVTRGWTLASENRLEIALRLVSEAEADVARQKLIIAELEKRGHPAVGAHALLRSLDKNLHEYREAAALLKMAEP